MKVILARPRGFCAGVDRAVEIVEKTIEVFGPPVYVRHEIVHNRHVVEDLRRKGAVFVDDLEEVPEGAVVVYSAHGVSLEVRAHALRRKLRPIDATCPLVTKVHLEAIRFAQEGYHLLLIGHAGHPEVEGTMGQVPDRFQLIGSVEEAKKVQVFDPARVAYLTQTTLSVEDTAEIVAVLKERFPSIRGPSKDDICYATQNRQWAVKELAQQADLILVVGAKNSSNATRMREVAEKAGVKAHRVDSAASVDPAWLLGVSTVGVTSGASTPEPLVEELVQFLRARGVTQVDEIRVVEETIRFPLPVIGP